MKPYCMSKYIHEEDLLRDVMKAEDLTEVERLSFIWNSLECKEKEEIKCVSKNLYCCILSVINEGRGC